MAASDLRWAPVVGYEGAYEVSCDGEIRSLTRVTKYTRPNGTVVERTYPGAVKALHEDKDGYKAVALSKDGKQKTHRVSRLVLIAFCGNPGGLLEACHVNHDKSNNTLGNLYWGTREQNEADKTLAGRRPRSTVNKITPESAQLARLLYARKWTQMNIAKVLSCHQTNVSLILRGYTWQM